MSKNNKPTAMLRRSSTAALCCAGLLNLSVAFSENYKEALDEAERESPHQNEVMQDPRREALKEVDRETPHQRELSQDPVEEALEADKSERP